MLADTGRGDPCEFGQTANVRLALSKGPQDLHPGRVRKEPEAGGGPVDCGLGRHGEATGAYVHGGPQDMVGVMAVPLAAERRSWACSLRRLRLAVWLLVWLSGCLAVCVTVQVAYLA
ncbi:MAG: hypothetical protein NVSMB55_09680 [Mycobacteriales bacterium]